VALVILGLGGWTGWKLGAWTGHTWSQHKEQKWGELHGPERAHLERVLAELDALGVLRVYVVVVHGQEKLVKKYVLSEISGLEKRIEQPDMPDEVRPAVTFELGLAYIDAAMAEERDNNKQAAAKYMRSAQTLMKSLGWQDCSEETLRIVARRELGEWSPQPLTKENGK
jgi:hypothetical protein